MKRKTRASSDETTEKKSKATSPLAQEVLKCYGVLAAVKPIPRSLLIRFLMHSGAGEQEAESTLKQVDEKSDEVLPSDDETVNNIVYALIDEYEKTTAERATWLPYLDCLLPKVTNGTRASVLYMKGELTKDQVEAKRLFEEALPIFESTSGRRSISVSRTLHSIADLCVNRNEAKFLLRRALNIVGNENNVEVLPILQSLANIAETPKEKLTYLEDMRSVSVSRLGYTHPETGQVMLQLANQHEEMGNTQEAIAHYGHAKRSLRDETIQANIERLEKPTCIIH